MRSFELPLATAIREKSNGEGSVATRGSGTTDVVSYADPSEPTNTISECSSGAR